MGLIPTFRSKTMCTPFRLENPPTRSNCCKFHNALPSTPIEATTLSAHFQHVNNGVSTSSSFLPQHPTTTASHNYMSPVFGRHPYASDTSNVQCSNEPGSLQNTTTFDSLQMRQKAARFSTIRRSSQKYRSVAKQRKPSSDAKRSHIARPLTLYNFFFRVERSRLIEEISIYANETTIDPASSLQEFYASVVRDPSTFIEQVLQDHLSRDPSQKRKHQKVHGKISFESLTHLIAANWNAVPDLVKDVFRQIAARYLQRYDNEVLVQNEALKGVDE
jgi:hypothetical protein